MIMGQHYPVERPPGGDRRFTLLLVWHVALVLAYHGFPPFTEHNTRDFCRLEGALREFLFGEDAP